MKMKVLSLLGPVIEQQERKVTHKMNLFVSVSGVVEIDSSYYNIFLWSSKNV